MDFTDYYASLKRARANQQTTQQAVRPTAQPLDFSGFAGLAKQSKEGSPPDPLTWLIDMISRPLYGVTNAVEKSIEAPYKVKEKIEQGDPVGSFGEALAGQFIPASFLEGMFSNDPKVKRTFSDVIEQSTDAIGKGSNPDYVDEQDNVNPILKGVLGFTGDVLLDPLTWVPGAVIAKAGGAIAKGVKGLTGATKVGLEAARSSLKGEAALPATKAAADALSPTTDVSALAAKEVLDNAASTAVKQPYSVVGHNRSTSFVKGFDSEDEVNSFLKMLDEKGWKKSESANPQQIGKYNLIDNTLKGQVKTSEKATEVTKFLDQLDAAAQPIKKGKKAKPVAVEPLTSQKWLAEVAQKAPKYVVATIGTGRTARKLTASQAIEYLKNEAVSSAMKSAVTRQLATKFTKYQTDFAEAAMAGKTLDAVGNEIIAPKPIEVIDRMTAYQAKLIADEAAVEDVLGTPLMKYLASKQQGHTFDEAVATIRQALAGQSDLEKALVAKGAEGATTRALLKSLGIDTERAVPSPMQATSNPVGDAAVVANMGEGTEAWAIEAYEVFREVFRHNFKDLLDYVHKTKGGTLRTAKKMAEGLGRNEREANGFVQYELFTRLFERYAKAEYREAKGLTKLRAGKTRAATLAGDFEPRLRAVEDFLDHNGLPLTIGVGTRAIPLRTTQLLDVLGETNPDVVLRSFYNWETAVALSNVQEAFLKAAQGAPLEEIKAQLLNTLKLGKKGELLEEALPNNMAKGGRYGFTPANKRKSLPPKKDGISYQWNKGRTGWYAVYSSERLADDLARTVMEATPRLNQIVAANSAALAARRGTEVYEMGTEELRKLDNLLSSPETSVKAIQELAELPRRLEDVAKTKGAMQDSLDATEAIVDLAVPTVLKTTAEAAEKVEAAGRTASKNPKSTAKQIVDEAHAKSYKATQEVSDAVADDVKGVYKEAAPGAPDEVLDLASEYVQIGEETARWMNATKRSFQQDYQMARVFNPNHSMGNIAARITADMGKLLKGIGLKHGGNIAGTETSKLARAALVIQGKITDDTPEMVEAVADLKLAFARLFDTEMEGSILGSPFFRSNAALEELNDAMLRVGLDERYLFDLSKAAKSDDPDMLHALLNQWKEWDIPDPMDFLHRMTVAGVRIATNSAIGHSFMRNARAWGAVSEVPREGFVRFTSTGRSNFAAYLPQDVWIEKGLANEMHALDIMTRTSRHLEGEMGTFLRKYYTPVQNAWKKGITIYRLGHHVRNLLSDGSLTFTAEGGRFYTSSARDATKLLSAANSYPGVDAVKMLQEFGEYKLPGTGDLLASGKLGDMTLDDIAKAANEAGLMTTARIVEDLYDDAVLAGGLTKAMDKLTLEGSKLSEVAKGVSQFTAHFGRLQHFMQIIHKVQKTGLDHLGRPIKSQKELFEYASKRVKRFHPDNLMLTPFEAKYLRHIIPFYTWFGKVMPAIIESMMLNPGRVLAFNKASYNLAVSMGVNPDSLSDPFPTDQLFPSFLTEQVLGPQFGNAVDGYYGINPGFAHLDIMDTFGHDPLRGVAGMVSPLIRTPAELLSGGAWGTGAKINDASDYLDSSLPVVNYLANVSGYSPTGSVVSMLQGKGLDPQLQVARGNKGPSDQLLSVLNWLTGVGATNMSRPNFINYAEIEKRNREGTSQRSGF